MDWMLLLYSLKNSLFRTIYAVFSIFVMVLVFRMLDVYVIKDIDTLKELQKGNVAVAIVVAALFMATAIVIGLISI